MVSQIASATLALLYFSAHRCDLAFAHNVERHDIRETAAFHVLHHNPQISLSQKAVHEIDDILMLAVFHYQDLIYNQILLRLLLEVHLLDSHAAIRPILVCCVYTTRRALTDLIELSILRRRVALGADCK